MATWELKGEFFQLRKARPFARMDSSKLGWTMDDEKIVLQEEGKYASTPAYAIRWTQRDASPRGEAVIFPKEFEKEFS